MSLLKKKPTFSSSSLTPEGPTYIRKAVKLGNSSLVVSLPKNWITLINAKPGSYLSMRQRGMNLTISPQITPNIQPIGRIILRNYQTAAFEFYNLYILGYTLIKVENYTDTKQLTEFNNLIDRRLLGVQIIEESKKVSTFQVFSKNTLNPSVLLKRLRIVVANLLNYFSSVIDSKPVNSKKTQALLRSGFKLFFICLRRIYCADDYESKLKPPTYSQLISYTSILNSIGRIFENISYSDFDSFSYANSAELSKIFQKCTNYYLASLNHSLSIKNNKGPIQTEQFHSVSTEILEFIDKNKQENSKAHLDVFKICLFAIILLNEAQSLLPIVLDSTEN